VWYQDLNNNIIDKMIIIIIIIQWSIPGEGFSIPIHKTNSYIKNKIPTYSVYLKSICLRDQKYNYTDIHHLFKIY
jgi:hypothetical protein